MIINCKKCYKLGYECPEHKEKKKRALNRKESAEKKQQGK